jgi:hypothetical protein
MALPTIRDLRPHQLEEYSSWRMELMWLEASFLPRTSLNTAHLTKSLDWVWSEFGTRYWMIRRQTRISTKYEANLRT